MRRTRPAILFLTLLSLCLLTVGSFFSADASPQGVLTPTVTTQHVTGAPITADPAAVNVTKCVPGVNCGVIPFRVDVPDNFYPTNSRVLRVAVGWVGDADLDLYLCRTSSSSVNACLDTLVGQSSTTSGSNETVTLRNPAAGDYRAMVAAARGTATYDGLVTFDAPVASDQPAPEGLTDTNSDGDFSWQSRAVDPASNFGEPSLDLDHAGNVYVTAPGGAGVQMWRSFDGGNSFDHKEIPAPNGGGDSEIEFTLNDVGFTADLEVEDSAVSRSTNSFNDWTQQPVGIEQDRQWLAHQCSKDVFLVYHDFVVEAELLNASHDAGKTWDTAPVPVSPDNTAPGSQDDDTRIYGDQQANTFSGKMAVNQKNGDVYVVFAISTAQGNATTGVPPYGEPKQVVVGVSHDKGQTFELHLVKGASDEGALAGLIFPWITIDKAGTVYVSWAGRETADDPINVYMTYSKNRGDSWAKPYVVNQDKTGHAHVYTTISAGDPGVVDVAWYTGSKPDPSDVTSEWFLDFAQVRNADSQSPSVSQSRVYSQPLHKGDICLNGLLCIAGGDRSLLDFFEIQVGADGMANIAFDNTQSPDNQRRVWYARQTSGPSAGNALHDMQFCSAKGPDIKLPGPKVRRRVSDKTPARGETVTFYTRLARCSGNSRSHISLEKKVQGKWKSLKTKTLNKHCKSHFKIPANFKKGTYRTFWPKQNQKYRAGHSRPVTITTH